VAVEPFSDCNVTAREPTHPAETLFDFKDLNACTTREAKRIG
jgi:hypothetical protein